MRISLGSLGYLEDEDTKCELCGRQAYGCQLCKECREYARAMEGVYLVDRTIESESH